MAPTHSKPIPEPRPPGAHKCVLALEAMAAEHQQRQPSIQDADADDDNQDNDHTVNTSLQPQNASCILEAADGSDDVEADVAMGGWGGSSDDEEMPGLEDIDTSDEEDEDDAEDEDDEEGEVEETDHHPDVLLNEP
ncbi:uncharacterized protein LACBIDRAFT_322704 [Laccaria bicolor S238N-H82]|uniref:Predicted protein n=1 Tax=Laccaria bicolor (strain S238N-H82 / ATCC MYA-4686) TaxID=486041 RepID=B0CX88_LACBS|nr:uncharacterized protein LACBIDRAFT_322704 [Laccaria bicolor S238N-H82]EDR13631.1 predicted protein [Laccaria bicolor S238N-H82]|eukprot:XP_001876129.1 predicted protein [Laccaria bicolor S238N-H82]